MDTAAFSADDEIVLSDRHSTFKRLLLIAAGLFCLIMPVWDLGRGLTSLSVFTMFAAVIVLGAGAIGATLLWSGLFGDSTELRIAPGGITLWRGNLFRSRQGPVKSRDIVAVDVREIDWDSSAPTYALKITLASGSVLGTSDFARREDAEALVRRVRYALEGFALRPDPVGSGNRSRWVRARPQAATRRAGEKTSTLTLSPSNTQNEPCGTSCQPVSPLSRGSDTTARPPSTSDQR